LPPLATRVLSGLIATLRIHPSWAFTFFAGEGDSEEAGHQISVSSPPALIKVWPSLLSAKANAQESCPVNAMRLPPGKSQR